MNQTNQTVIVTGAARGIGQATAVAFAKKNARVVLCDLKLDWLEETRALVKEAGGESLAYEVDVVDRDSIARMVADVIQQWNRIDVLVNNAGITADAQLKKMSEEAFDQVIDINLKGVFNCTQAVLPAMLEQQDGVILNASSVVGVYGNFGQTNYAATKWGVIGMTKTWAKELGKNGIRVNAVAPGFIATPMVAKMPENVLDMMKGKSPLNRLGKPEDVANAYVFLASQEAGFITGTVLSVDGGVVL
ncbi:3-oxoacyl-[acyl-carrier-protein] reductase [Anoxynatronum buryatiense]|uniref:3-oxoacyl-[acyl-carrier-protein] reductase n=1 Tax=Anoxynatronum buryatiense TaxID=489973 RepID=A0AA45WTA2_9CLOT|nr:3-oxoacyl-[acyl-carrier-protein] reductase [Anoxynatronum buryatiense]SMP40973.1 3-oxoacyl-[acyl-carrier-protein] reductase [Anoxynatronum buryatiense]